MVQNGRFKGDSSFVDLEGIGKGHSGLYEKCSESSCHAASVERCNMCCAGFCARDYNTHRVKTHRFKKKKA